MEASTKISQEQEPKPLWDPYVAGVALGLVLLSTFLVFGRGLGASGALTRATAWVSSFFAPEWVYANGHLGGYFGRGAAWWEDWLVFEVVGVALGGLFGGLTSRRMKVEVEAGPRVKPRTRLVLSGATLALGSWAFMMAVFGGAYGLAYFVRRLWT
jgi:hypothetical protein